MEIHYVVSHEKYNRDYNLSLFKESPKSIAHIKGEIQTIPDFCGEEEISIQTRELKGYLSSGISFFTEDEMGNITGLINFSPNEPNISILGLCVPHGRRGIGKFLLDAVKVFAMRNRFEKLILTCYTTPEYKKNERQNVSYFYLKQGFKFKKGKSRGTIETSTSPRGSKSPGVPVYDSDEEDITKIRYDMYFDLTSSGGKSISRSRNKRRKRKATRKH
jgi:GNAT superfamily N-acetyltransferase